MSCSTKSTHRWYQDYALVFVVFIIVWATRKWQGGSLIISDGYYYVTIARNVVEGLGFTYDTIHTTNGFHWMWMLILLVLCGIAGLIVQLDSIQLIESVFALNCLLWAYSALVFYRLLQHLRVGVWPRYILSIVTAIVFTDPGLTQNAINGLETALFLLILLLLANAFIEKRPWPCAILFQLLVFTRIEGLAVLPILLYEFRNSFRSPAFISMLFPFGVAATFALNFVVDGSALSSSSMAKAFWAARARTDFFWSLGFKEQIVLVLKDAVYLPCAYLSNILSIFANPSILALVGLSLVFILIVLGTARCVTTVSFSDLSGLCFKIFPLILFCFVSYLVYKSYYFTPRSFAFKDLFPVTDYQSRYYFAPHLILLLTGIQLAILNSFRSYLAGLMALLAITGISWIMFLRDERSTTSSVVSSVCLPAPSAVYAVANDDGFAYYTRLPIVVLDGLVTGHRISDGASYLESMQSQSVHSYITALKVRYLKLGAEKHLNFLAAPGTNERFSKEGRVVSLCGMGEWIELRREDLSAS